jgi:hypothetical protein
MSNFERLQTFSERRPPTGAEVNTELQMIVEQFNDHNQGRK